MSTDNMPGVNKKKWKVSQKLLTASYRIVIWSEVCRSGWCKHCWRTVLVRCWVLFCMSHWYELPDQVFLSWIIKVLTKISAQILTQCSDMWQFVAIFATASWFQHCFYFSCCLLSFLTYVSISYLIP